MNLNLLVMPTLIVAFLLFWAGQALIGRSRSVTSKSLVALAAFVLGVPGFLIALYYLHVFDDAQWFYEFRSLPFIELSAAGAGLFAGVLAGLLRRPKLVSRAFLAAVLCLGIVGPHLKPVLAPVRSSRFSDRWMEDVCLQSTQSSCGAANAASIFRMLGVNISEKEIARECFTYLGGTENWYLARAFRRRGFKVTYRVGAKPAPELPVPSIAGVKVGGMGHFIPILSESETSYVVGDPLVGRREHPKDRIQHNYQFTGFFMVVKDRTSG